MAESRRVSSCRVVLLGLAFFTIGLCISVIGPTLPDLMSQTNEKFVSDTVLVVSSNALGSIVGLILGVLCLKTVNSFSVISLTLFFCSLVTLVIPFCKTLAAAVLVYFLQGVCLGLLLKGVMAQFYSYWKQRYQIIIILYFIITLGATLSPLITSGFVFNAKVQNDSLLNDSAVDSFSVASFHIIRRDVTEDYANVTTDEPPLLSNYSMSDTNIATRSDEITTLTVTGKKIQSVTATSASLTVSTAFQLTSSTAGSTVTNKHIQKTLLETLMMMVKEFNDAKAAYILISMFSLVSALSYSFVCCCTSCRWMKTPPAQNSDYPFKCKTTWSSKTNFFAVAASILFAFFTGAVESNLANMLTFYCMIALQKPQASGVLLTTVFWFSVSLSRLTALFFHKKIWHVVPVGFTVGVAILSCTATTLHYSWTTLYISVAVFGLSTGYLGPIGYCWLDQQLGMGSWFSTVWLIAVQCSCAVVPYVTACSMGVIGQNPLMFPIVQLVLMVILGLTTGVFIKAVSQASQLTFVDKLVLTTNDDVFAYKKHVNEEDVTELDHFDEFTHFDRHNAVSYFVKQPTTPSILK